MTSTNVVSQPAIPAEAVGGSARMSGRDGDGGADRFRGTAVGAGCGPRETCRSRYCHGGWSYAS